MRFIYVFILFLFVSHVLAQDVNKIKVTYKNNGSSIKEIFADLEKQYGIRFSICSQESLSKEIKVSFKNESIEKVLDELLYGQEIEYKIVSNNVLLRKTNSSESTFTEDPSYISLKGKVYNKIQNELLEFATVTIRNTSIGTYTNEQGDFHIEIPTVYRDSFIEISYLGYEHSIYKISEKQDQFLFIPLTENSNLVEQIEIINREKPIQIRNFNSSITLNNSQINSYTSGLMGADINRSIQLLPGITAHNDNDASIKIRGSNSDETLMILDGMPIYNASHYFGLFSAINASFIDSVNIYKNNYPEEFGGKTGGLVELLSDQKFNHKRTGELEVDLFSIKSKINIPLTEQSNLQIAGRSTLRKISNDQFNTTKTIGRSESFIKNFKEKIDRQKSNPSFNFYDLNSKYLYKKTNDDYINLNFYLSADGVTNDYKIIVKDENSNTVNLNILNVDKWSNFGSSFNSSKSLSKKLINKTTLYYSKYSKNAETQINIFKIFTDNDQNNKPLNASLFFSQFNTINDFGIDNHIKYKNKNNEWKIGVSISNQDIVYNFTENKNAILDGNNSLLSFSTYGSYDYILKEKVSIHAGLRVTNTPSINNLFVSPRILLKYKLSDIASFKSSFSIYQQTVRQLYFEYRGAPTEIWAAAEGLIPSLESQNIMLGGTFRFPSFSIDVEAYQKSLTGVIEYSNVSPGNAENNTNVPSEYIFFTGTGRIRGLDLIVSSGYKNYETYLSYTLSKNVERYNEIYNNNYFASENDRRHQFKWVNSYTYNKWNFGFNTIYSSGRIYTDPSKILANTDIRGLGIDQRFSRLPAYFRMDISSGYDFKIKHSNVGLSFSIFNLTNNQNVQYIQSVVTELQANQTSVNSVIGNESSLLNRTFNVGLKIGL